MQNAERHVECLVRDHLALQSLVWKCTLLLYQKPKEFRKGKESVIAPSCTPIDELLITQAQSMCAVTTPKCARLMEGSFSLPKNSKDDDIAKHPKHRKKRAIKFIEQEI